MSQKVMCIGLRNGWSQHPPAQMLCPECDPPSPGDAITGSAAGGKVLRLSDVSRDKVGRITLPVAFSEGGGEYAAVEMGVLLAYEAQQLALSEVAGHVRSGMISPAKRESFERVALSDLPTFRAILSDMKPMVDLTEYGHGGTGNGVGGDSAEREVIGLSEARATAEGISFSEAMKRVGKDKPELFARYQSVLRSTMRRDD